MNQEHDSKSATIQRAPHDKQNPYLMVSRDFMRDLTISANCHRLLSLLLSNVDDWVIRIPQLVKQLQPVMGRDAVYAAVNEALEAGYMQREEYFENNFVRLQYFVSEFKKSFRHPENQDAGNPDTGTPHHKKEQRKERSSKEPLPPSADGAYSFNRITRKGLRSTGDNPRAKQAEQNHRWAQLLRIAVSSRSSDIEVDFSPAGDMLRIQKMGANPWSREWAVNKLGIPTRTAILSRLTASGCSIDHRDMEVKGQNA